MIMIFFGYKLGEKQFKVLMVWIFLLVFLRWSTGRPINDDLRSTLRQNFGRQLHKFIGNCSKGSDQILQEYPPVVSIRNPFSENPSVTSLPQDLQEFNGSPSYIEEPNVYVLCGGVLLSRDTILTSTGCIWQEVENGIPLNLVLDNPVSRTFERDFRAAISPYCTHGDGAEVLQILGYHFMEDDYTGYPKDGNAVAVLELRENVTSLLNSQLPALRTTPLAIGSIITMVGHGATNNQEASLANSNYSRPYKEINYTTISDEECTRLLNNIQSDKVLDGVTESCAVVQEIGGVNICNGDDGNPLYDQDGNIAGIITWWPINQCERTRDKSMPIIFADVSKQKVQEFIQKSETESLYILPNITDGNLVRFVSVALQTARTSLYTELPCKELQALQAAPWSVAIQSTRINDRATYHHTCSGTLIDSGTKVVTAAQCIWDDSSPLSNSEIQMYVPIDYRQQPEKAYEGNFLFPIFASQAPSCEYTYQSQYSHLVYPRSQLSHYWIHPLYNGNPQDGYNIAILDFATQFHPTQSFPNFAGFLQSVDDRGLPQSAFSDVTFYGWGSQTISEDGEDGRSFFTNYFPAKKVSMELIPDDLCTPEDAALAFNHTSELCTISVKNSTSIQSYDIGGPLVGRITETNELVLLGLKSQLQVRQNFDNSGSRETFTDVIEMKDFILDVLDPPIPLQEANNGPSTVIITVATVGGSLLFIFVLGLTVWKRRSYNKKLHHSNKQLLQNGGNLPSEMFILNKNIQCIHIMLGNVARKQNNPQTGKARRHSDLAASLEFMLSYEKVEAQVLGYAKCSVDDTFLGPTRGAMPSSPFVLAAIQNQQVLTISENQQQPIQPNTIRDHFDRIQNRIQMSEAQNYGRKDLHNGNSNKGLIFPDTPARSDFDMTIDFYKELQIGDRLGTGAFGSVYKAVWLTRNMEVAVKIIHAHILEQLIDDQGQGGNFFNSIVGELCLLGQINSTHIVKCYGGSLKPPKAYLVLEYLSNGSLDKFIHNYHGEMPTGLIMRVAQGIAEGLDALHPTIVHRDLKPQNVLLDDNYQVKLADFGMSKMKEDTYLSETAGIRGTPVYMAPEALKEESVDEKCDIYALGLIMWEMVAKERPWKDTSFPVIMARVAIKGERPLIPDTCPSGLKRLIQRCWATNPRERPTAREAVQRLAILRRGQTKGSTSDHTAFQSRFSSVLGQSTQNMAPQQFSLNFSNFSIEC